MILSLDTHALLWWLSDPALLSKQAREAIEDGRNVTFVSVAVVWEIVIKKALGKLVAPNNLADVLVANRFDPLAIDLRHVEAIAGLPHHHRDPFDRILVAQSIEEGFRLVTRDPLILQYDVPHLIA